MLVTNVHIPGSGIRKKRTKLELVENFKKFNLNWN
ncbi:hypothetical protein AYI68_g1135, partial [Smittium mucronatum]